jgi:hypothetical protein
MHEGTWRRPNYKNQRLKFQVLKKTKPIFEFRHIASQVLPQIVLDPEMLVLQNR